jgi:hypothetical protein
VWDTTINASAKGLQEQVAGVASFGIPLAEADGPKIIKAVYLTEAQSEEPALATEHGCPGNTNNPEAAPGKFCVFTGGFFGSQEKGWKNAHFWSFAEPNGEFNSAVPGSTTIEEREGFAGRKGALIIFRTKEFAEPPKAELALVLPANMSTGGSWAVTAP